jgi:UDP-N-acetylglucosamine--N-acetylmuramyl-(pentapeptide) pyrophosphoryl-undecaprenol N-acetylglucosamine transferase
VSVVNQGVDTRSYRIALVGGGTAGHVEPALAVGEWLRSHAPQVSCDFIGTKEGIEVRLVPAAGFPLHMISKVPMPRSLTPRVLLWPFALLRSTRAARRILRRCDLVIGFGGYVSAPCYLAARLLRIPIIIHEANAKPGWANRLGARFASRLVIAFAGARRLGGVWADAQLVGMPIKEKIADLGRLSSDQRGDIRRTLCGEIGFNPEEPILFVFGGSLGAKVINKGISEFLGYGIKDGIQIIHALGRNETLPIRTTRYFPISYVDDMASMYASADMIISRSGAVSCAEIEATGKYALLIPLPIGNGEQEANAEDLVRQGAAEICPNSSFTGVWLAKNIDRLLDQARDFYSRRTPIKFSDSAERIGVMSLELLGYRSDGSHLTSGSAE